MQIKIIGKSPNDVDAVWEISRPGKEFDPEEIKKLDLPVNEFFTLHLHIKSNILIREILTSKNNHIMWAQTSRVQNILEFEVDPTMQCNELYFMIVRNIMKENAKTQRQDDYRTLLPAFSMTEYSISISIRNLIKIGKYFDYLFTKTGIYSFLNAAREMEFIAISCGYHARHTENYKMEKLLCEDYAEPTQSAIRNGNFITVSTKLPLHLRAQLVRHRGVMVVDNLLDLLIREQHSAHLINLNTEISCQVIGQVSAFQEILSKRSCWIAQYNIWSDFLNKVSSVVPEVKLPCSGGACPFDGDAMLRYKGQDPNPPCPIHLSLNKLSPTYSDVSRMSKMVKDDNRPEFWNTEIQKLEI